MLNASDLLRWAADHWVLSMILFNTVVLVWALRQEVRGK